MAVAFSGTSRLLLADFSLPIIALRHECAPLDESIFLPEMADDPISGFRTLVPFYCYFAQLCNSLAE